MTKRNAEPVSVDPGSMVDETAASTPRIERKTNSRGGGLVKAIAVGLSALALTGAPEPATAERASAHIEKSDLGAYAETLALPYANCQVTSVQDDHGLSKPLRNGGDDPTRTTIHIGIRTPNSSSADQAYADLEKNKDADVSQPLGAGWLLARDENGQYKRARQVSGSGSDPMKRDRQDNEFSLSPSTKYQDGTRMLVTVHTGATAYGPMDEIGQRAVHERVGATPCGWIELSEGAWHETSEPLPPELAQPMITHSSDRLPR